MSTKNQHLFHCICLALLAGLAVADTAAAGERPRLRLALWERGVSFSAPDMPEMKVYLWFYEWNMFEARDRGQHTRGTFNLPHKIDKQGATAEVGGKDLHLLVKAGDGAADLTLTIVNSSKHDWPEVAGIIPCFNPGPRDTRNRQFANTLTYFHGPRGLERLIKREIHFNALLREGIGRRAEDGKFVFSGKWPTSPVNATKGLLVRESTGGQWVTGIAWDDFLSAQGHNPWECMHLGVRVGPLKRGEKKTIRGKVYLFRGKKEDCLKRFTADFRR